jgi:DNA primase
MAFSDSVLDEVRRAADIVRLISEHVTLKKMGSSWKGLCPFHQEKTPSFNVRQDPPIFHCFGCGEGGDVFKFVMLRERVSFPEAVKMVADRFGVRVPESRFEPPGPDRKERDDLLALLQAAAEHFTRNLWSAPGIRAREYLLGRGFRKDTLERIGTGAAAASWSDLLEALRRRFPLGELLTAGLILERQDHRGHYDRFRNRAVFPIQNDSGRVVAFGARALDEASGEPKYLNSPESPVYQKGRTLYGLSWAKDAIRKEGRAVLMEGYLDVARALEAGVGGVVATCGTALTAGHAHLLRRFTEKVLVNFDQDEAGQKAARKSVDILLDEALQVRVVELPGGHDPDTFLKEFGADAYRERLEAAPLYMEWLIRRAGTENDLSSPPGKAAYLASLLPSLVRIESAVERAAWLTTIVERGRLDEAAARDELRRALGARIRTMPAPEERVVAPKRAALLPAERWLLALMMQGAEGVAAAVTELLENELDGLRSAAVLRVARAIAAEGAAPTPAALSDRLENEDDRRMLNELAVQGAPEEGLTPADCVRELKTVPLKARMAEIQRDLGAASGAALEELLAEKLRLKRRMASLSL